MVDSERGGCGGGTVLCRRRPTSKIKYNNISTTVLGFTFPMTKIPT